MIHGGMATGAQGCRDLGLQGAIKGIQGYKGYRSTRATGYKGYKGIQGYKGYWDTGPQGCRVTGMQRINRHRVQGYR